METPARYVLHYLLATLFYIFDADEDGARDDIDDDFASRLLVALLGRISLCLCGVSRRARIWNRAALSALRACRACPSSDRIRRRVDRCT